MAKFTASSLGLTIEAPVNTKEVEVSFYDLLDGEVKSDLISKNAVASQVLADMKAQVSAIRAAAWEQVRALVEPAAEELILSHLVGIDAIEAGGKVYNLLEAVERRFELFCSGAEKQYKERYASYTLKDGTVRWNEPELVEELEALRAALPEGLDGMYITKQRAIAAKAMSYQTNAKTLNV